MRIFLDSSALAKRFVEEHDSDRLALLCRDAEEIIVSSLCVPELISGFNRLRRENKLSAGRYGALKRSLAADMEEATVIDLTSHVIGRTIEVLEHASVRALDAIHLAAALEAGCDLFVTADRRQNQAAARLSLKTELFGGRPA